MSFTKANAPKIIAFSAMFIAIGVVLGFFKIPVTSLIEIRLQSLPVMLAGCLFGPFVGGTVGASVDIVSYLVKPTGAFFPGFTISQAVTGIIFGLLLYKKRGSAARTALRVTVAGVLNTAVVSLLLNNIWLSLLYSMSFAQSFITRLPAGLVMLPINIILVFVTLRAIQAVFARQFETA